MRMLTRSFCLVLMVTGALLAQVIIMNSSSNVLAVVTQNGALGIGTSNPAEKVHVVGDLRASSLANDPGTAFLTADPSGLLLANGPNPLVPEYDHGNWNALGTGNDPSFSFNLNAPHVNYLGEILAEPQMPATDIEEESSKMFYHYQTGTQKLTVTGIFLNSALQAEHAFTISNASITTSWTTIVNFAPELIYNPPDQIVMRVRRNESSTPPTLEFKIYFQFKDATFYIAHGIWNVRKY